jgi:hypothetical protein
VSLSAIAGVVGKPFNFVNYHGVADYGYDFNFFADRKAYIHRNFDLVKIGFSDLDSATPLSLYRLGCTIIAILAL